LGSRHCIAEPTNTTTQLEFATAANLYEKIVKKHPADQVAKIRLTQCYKFLKTRSDWRNQPGGKKNPSGANVPVR